MFVDIMYENFLQPCIIKPSRIINDQKLSIVDNIFTNIINKNITSGNLFSKISDHMPNFILIENLVHKPKRRKVTKRDFSKFNEESYQQDLSFITIDHLLNSTDINTIYDDFHLQLINVIDNHAPIKTYSKRESKRLQKSIQIKNGLYKIFF